MSRCQLCHQLRRWLVYHESTDSQVCEDRTECLHELELNERRPRRRRRDLAAAGGVR